MTDETNTIQVGGEGGPVYVLVAPHTLDTIRADAANAADRRKPWRCRSGHHDWQVIGRAPETNDIYDIAAWFTAIHYNDLEQCTRCKKMRNGIRF